MTRVTDARRYPVQAVRRLVLSICVLLSRLGSGGQLPFQGFCMDSILCLPTKVKSKDVHVVCHNEGFVNVSPLYLHRLPLSLYVRPSVLFVAVRRGVNAVMAAILQPNSSVDLKVRFFRNYLRFNEYVVHGGQRDRRRRDRRRTRSRFCRDWDVLVK